MALQSRGWRGFLHRNDWRKGVNGLAVQPKARSERKGATVTSSIFEFDNVHTAEFFDADDCADIAAGDVF